MALSLSRLFHLQKNTLLQKHKAINGIKNKEILILHNNFGKDIVYKCNVKNYHCIKKHISKSIIKIKSIKFYNFSNSSNYNYNPLIKLNTRSDILKTKYFFQNSLVPNGVHFHCSYIITKKPKNTIIWKYCSFKNYSDKNGKNEKDYQKDLLLCLKLKKKDSEKGKDSDKRKDKTKEALKQENDSKPKGADIKPKDSCENVNKKPEETQKQPKDDPTKKEASCKPEKSSCGKLQTDTIGINIKCNVIEKDETCKKTKKDETCKKPEKDKTCKKPEKDETCKKPKKDETCKKPEEKTCKKPEKDETCKKPKKDETCKKPKKDETCKKPEEDKTCKKPEKEETCKKPKKDEKRKMESEHEKKCKTKPDIKKKEISFKTDPCKKKIKPDCKKKVKKGNFEIKLDISSPCDTHKSEKGKKDTCKKEETCKRDPSKDTCKTNDNNKSKIKQCDKTDPSMQKKDQSQKGGKQILCSIKIDIPPTCEEKKVSVKECEKDSDSESKKYHNVKTVTSCDKAKKDDVKADNTCNNRILQDKKKEDLCKKEKSPKRKRPRIKCELVEVDLTKFHTDPPKPLRPPLSKHKKTDKGNCKTNKSSKCQSKNNNKKNSVKLKYNMKIKPCSGTRCKKKSHVKPKSPRPPQPRTPNSSEKGKK